MPDEMQPPDARRRIVDAALEESDALEAEPAFGPTFLLRFKQVQRVQESTTTRTGKARIRESERQIHVGSLRLEPSGKLESDLRSATLHGLLALNVFPLIDDEQLHLGSEGGIDRLHAACEAAIAGRFVVERIEVDDDADALERLREGSLWGSVSPDWGGPAAPWSPLPLRPTRKFIAENPDAQVEIIFPTVYEEDRSKKIQDLATAEGLKVISHRRMAEQMAKELQQEQYDYDEEQEDIQLHPSPVGGALASAVVGQGMGVGTPGGVGGPGADEMVKAIMKGAPKPGAPTRAEMASGSRPGMDAASRADFRQQQRGQISEAVAETPFVEEPRAPEPAAPDPAVRELAESQGRLLTAVDDLRVGLRTLADTVSQLRIPAPLPPAAPPNIVVEAAPPVPAPPAPIDIGVHVPPLVPPASHIHVPPASVHISTPPRRRRVEYDEEGRIIGLVDEVEPDE